MLEFRLLGQFDVRLDSAHIVISSRPAQSLLAYLLLTRTTTHRREKLAGLFWPDSSETNARRSLRQELWRIRKALDACSPPHSDFLSSDDLSVRIDPNSNYWLDVAVLENTITGSSSTDDLMRSLDVYQGELLPDFYDEWATLERERLRALFEQQMQRLLDALLAEQHWKDILDWAERWIARGKSPEPAYRALMLAHSAQGNRSQVATVFERCVVALREDLGVEPSKQTCALYEQLRAGEKISKGAENASTGAQRGNRGETSSLLPRFPASLPSDLSPYKGLCYFDEADAPWFFGRERLVAVLVSHMSEHHLLTVVGASGSGKSSLVRAGLIPALKAQKPLAGITLPPNASHQWEIHVMTPTLHPLEALALSLTRGTPSLLTTTTLIDDLARDARALRVYAHRMVPERNRLVLVIDQFEELFTLCRDEGERKIFVDNLLNATAPELDQPISLVVALRADFYANAAQYTNLRDALAQRQEYIGPMSQDELRRAIEEPAKRGGWELEAGFVDLLLHEVEDEPGALPLLSHALLETWQRRRGRTLTLADYRASGGVRGAIAQTAESVYQQLSAEQQAIARNIFLRLTELGEGTQDTRRRVTLSEPIARAEDASNVETVMRKLADARLITLEENTAEVAHEALIREWSRLREWLTQNREGLRLHRHLTEAAQAWQKLDRDPGELYRGARLAQSLEWAKTNGDNLNPLEREFLEACKELQEHEEAEREAQRQRELIAAQKLAEEKSRAAQKLRQRAVFLAGALLFAAVLAILAILFAQQSNQNAERAENERLVAFTRELSVNAVNNLGIDPERSILLALQAVSLSTEGGKPVLQEAEEALHRAVQASRVQLTLRGHTAGLWDVAYSPDGKRLATASIDKTAKVWDAATGKELFTLCCHGDIVYAVAFSPDGTRLATGSWDRTAKIWDAVTGKELLTLRGHTDFIRGIAFSPDGTRVATASIDKTAKVWDAVTGQELFTLVGHTGGVSNITYSPAGTRLATSSYSDELEHTAKVWDAISGKLLLTLTGHSSAIYDVAFSPDGKRLATGSGDGTAKIWDNHSGQLLMTVFVHSSVLGVAFSPDGTRLATGNINGTAQVWDAVTGELLMTLSGHSSQLLGVSFSPDGTRLATASQDATAKVWDISPAGSREWLTIAGHTLGVLHLAYSADGRQLATASADKTAKVWDAVTGQELLTLSGHTGEVQGVVFSPDGSRLATTGSDQTVKVWDAATGKQLLSLSTSSFPMPVGLGVAFSPDGQRIASSTAQGTAKVWDAATGKELLTLCCHTPSYVTGIAFGPDGMRLATAGFDRVARVWDAATGKALLTLSGHTGGLWALTFSPDGHRIATASVDGTAKVWDATTGQLLLTLLGHTGSIWDVAFSPDGKRVATGSGDGTVKVWDVSTASAQSEQPLTLYIPNAIVVAGVAFSPDGKRLAATGADPTVRIYALPLDDIIAIAKSRVTRTLTTDECQKFLHTEQCSLK